MGAIAGILYPEHSPLSYAVGAMLEALAPRAPQDPFTYLYKNFELGSRGEPIGHDRPRLYSLAVDGRVTNEGSLRSSLKKEGFPVEEASLAGLLVMAYEHWGPNFAQHLQGPFAIALHDQRRMELHLLRDRLGIHPLYWAYQGGSLLFASELKALLASGMIPQVVDEDAMSAYLFLGYVPQDLSPIKGVNKLLPGCRLTLSGPGHLLIAPYWSYGALLSEDRPLEGGLLTERLRSELGKGLPSGRSSYPTDGRLSSLALASQIDQGEALAVEYEGQNGEEVQRVWEASQRLGHGVKMASLSPAALLSSLPEVVWHLDEPLADPSVMGLWSLLKGPASSAEHLVTDVGCSELFATHKRYSDPELLSLLQHPTPASPTGLKGLALQLLSHVAPTPLFSHLRKAHGRPWLHYYIGKEALFPASMLRALSPQIPRHFDPDAFIERLFQLSGLQSTPSAYLFLDERTLLPGKLLLPYDRLCSARQIPFSAPFLSEPLVELMASIPDQQKLASDPRHHPLFQLLSPSLQELPPVQPEGKNFLNPYLNDPTIRQALEYLTGGTLVETGWLDRRWIRKALQRHTPVTFTQLWGLLNLEIWMRLFINAPEVGKPPATPLFQLLQKG
ncbi:MAG: asparagine synthetase B [Parachlamydiales bacterium]